MGNSFRCFGIGGKRCLDGGPFLFIDNDPCQNLDETTDIETELFNYPLEARVTRFHISVSEVGSERSKGSERVLKRRAFEVEVKQQLTHVN